MTNLKNNYECVALEIWGVILTLEFNEEQHRTASDQFHHQLLCWVYGQNFGNILIINKFPNKEISLSSLIEKFSEYSAEEISLYLGKCKSWASKNKKRNRIFTSAKLLLLIAHTRLSINSESPTQFLKRIKLNINFSSIEYHRVRNSYLRNHSPHQEIELQEYSIEDQEKIKNEWIERADFDLSIDRKIELINKLENWAFSGWVTINDFYLYFFTNYHLKSTFDELFPEMKFKSREQIKRHFWGYAGDVNNNNPAKAKHCVFKACNLLKTKPNKKDLGQCDHQFLNKFMNHNFRNEITCNPNNELKNQWISFRLRMISLCKILYGDETPTEYSQCAALLFLTISAYGKNKDFLVRLFSNIDPGSILKGHSELSIHKFFNSKRVPFLIGTRKILVNIKLLSKLTNKSAKYLKRHLSDAPLDKSFLGKKLSSGKIVNSKSKFKCFYMYSSLYCGEDVTVVGVTAVALKDIKKFRDITDNMFKKALQRPHIYDSVLNGRVELLLVSTAKNIDSLENYVKHKCSQKYEFLTEFDPEINVDGLHTEAWIVDHNEVEKGIINEFCGCIDPVMPGHITNSPSEITDNKFYYYPLTYEDKFLGYTYAINDGDDSGLDVFFQNLSFEFDSFEKYKQWLFIPNSFLKNLSPYSLIANSNKDLRGLIYNDFDELLCTCPNEFG